MVVTTLAVCGMARKKKNLKKAHAVASLFVLFHFPGHIASLYIFISAAL